MSRGSSIVAWGLAAAQLVVTGSVIAKDKPSIVLAKTSNWVVDYDDDSCHLIGAFGADKQRVVARFTKFQPGDSFQLTLYGRPVAAEGPRADVKLDFGLPPGEPFTAAVGTRQTDPLLLITTTTLRARTGSDDVQTLTPAEEAAISQLNFQVERKQPYRLALGSMGPPMKAMRDCLSNLVEHWGYDPAAIAALTSPPEPIDRPGNWLNSSDFPALALMKGHNGIIQFRLDVDQSGKVQKCSVIGKTSPSDFDTATCSGVRRRARFKPALDQAGKPVKAFYINTVRWIAPD